MECSTRKEEPFLLFFSEIQTNINYKRETIKDCHYKIKIKTEIEIQILKVVQE